MIQHWKYHSVIQSLNKMYQVLSASKEVGLIEKDPEKPNINPKLEILIKVDLKNFSTHPIYQQVEEKVVSHLEKEYEMKVESYKPLFRKAFEYIINNKLTQELIDKMWKLYSMGSIKLTPEKLIGGILSYVSPIDKGELTNYLTAIKESEIDEKNKVVILEGALIVGLNMGGYVSKEALIYLTNNFDLEKRKEILKKIKNSAPFDTRDLLNAKNDEEWKKVLSNFYIRI